MEFPSAPVRRAGTARPQRATSMVRTNRLAVAQLEVSAATITDRDRTVEPGPGRRSALASAAAAIPSVAAPMQDSAGERDHARLPRPPPVRSAYRHARP